MRVTEGSPEPLGATETDTGTNFAVFSKHATGIELCLFDGDAETRVPLPARTGHVHHGHVDGIRAGQHYGFRAQGDGPRFNPAKLLTDPYARELTGEPDWHDALMGGDLDSAPYMPRSVVHPAPEPYSGTRPNVPWTDTVIYEAHVKGLTQLHPAVEHPGTFRGVASDLILDHLSKLGVTTLELLPTQAFITDGFLHARNLTNYWGYQTLGFFAPHAAYGSPADFRHMVERVHGRGIEIVMDVVYNHTGEGDETGPTLCFRGLDDASYYRQADGEYVNDTGTGNTLNMDHPAVLRLVMDSLRYWREVMGVDGFRFDLAATLARTKHGFDPRSPFLQAVAQDPVLRTAKLIAEPWDIGPGGYRLGEFPHPFREWNDRYRDDVRHVWRGTGRLGALANRLTGSADTFERDGRPATATINFVTAHDGFNLRDTVSFSRRHNESNGEGGRDGHGHNVSSNMGAEGPTTDPAILAARAKRIRNFLATLFLSQGVPMLLAGDEIGHTQRGNNNAYNQDNETSWLNWREADEALFAFTERLIRLRAEHPVLRQSGWLHEEPAITWRRSDGAVKRDGDWADARTFTLDLRYGSGPDDDVLLAVFNIGPETNVTLPKGNWSVILDTADPCAVPCAVPCADPCAAPATLGVAAESVTVLIPAPV